MGSAGGWLLRRFVVLPVAAALVVFALAGAFLTVALSVLVCPVKALVAQRRVRWRPVRLAAMVALYAVGEVLTVLTCLLLWLLAIGRLRRPWVVRAHRRVLRLLLSTLLAAAGPAFGFHVRVEEPQRHPADLALAAQDRPLVVLARHAGPGASFALVEQLLRRWSRHVHVVLKDALRLDPAIDLLLTRTGCTWVPSARSGRRRTADVIAEAAGRQAGADALLLFPEGADWTPVRHLAAVARLRASSRREEARRALRMPHVLPPRPAGAAAALRHRGDAAVLVFTHTGHDELLDATSTWQALPLAASLRMAWWRVPDDELPIGDEDAVLAWLQDLWQDIDAWIDEQIALAALSDEGS